MGMGAHWLDTSLEGRCLIPPSMVVQNSWSTALLESMVVWSLPLSGFACLENNHKFSINLQKIGVNLHNHTVPREGLDRETMWGSHQELCSVSSPCLKIAGAAADKQWPPFYSKPMSPVWWRSVGTVCWPCSSFRVYFLTYFFICCYFL